MENKKPYIAPTLEIIDIESEEVMSCSHKPQGGWGSGGRPENDPCWKPKYRVEWGDFTEE